MQSPLKRLPSGLFRYELLRHIVFRTITQMQQVHGMLSVGPVSDTQRFDELRLSIHDPVYGLGILSSTDALKS